MHIIYSARWRSHIRAIFPLYIAEAPWSAAEWAVALLFVELLQAQLGRQVAYLLLLLCRASPPPDRKRSKRLLYVCLIKSTQRAFRGPNNFCWRAQYFLQEIERCADASIDRAAFFLASNISLAFTLHLSKEIDTSRFFGARKMFCWREKYSTLEKSSSKTFNVEKISVKKSTLKIFNVEKIKR